MTGFVNDNGEFLDYSGEDIGITKQAANFYDFKIKGDVSVNFKLDNNSQNRKALGYYGANQITPPLKTAFSMVKDGNLISRGFIVIQDSDEVIQAYFISGNTNWFQSFQFNLREILFPSTLSVLMSDVDGRKSATEGIIFPLVDYWAYGQKGGEYLKLPQSWNTDSPPEVSEVHPWLYLHTIVRYLSEHTGVVIGGDLLEDNLFKKIIISTPGADYSAPEQQIAATYSLLSAGPFPLAADGVYDGTIDPQPLRLNTVIEGVDYVDSSYVLTPPLTGTYRIEWTIRVGTTGTYSLDLYKNGSLEFQLFNGAITSGTDIKGVQWVNLIHQVPYQIMVSGSPATYRMDYLSGSVRFITNLSIKLEPVGGIQPAPSIGSGSETGYALPGFCVPDMKAIDFVKFLVNYFSCYVVYDEYANKISINKLSSLKKEDAQDWSDYYISHTTKWPKVATKNYIQTEQTEEENIKAYNESNNVSYGGGTIETVFESQDEKELFKIPFGGTWDWRNRSCLNMFFPYCKFYELEEVQTTTYSGVANAGGLAQFTSTWDDPTRETDLFFVKSTSGQYSGYFVASASGTVSNPILLVTYGANDTGTITKMKATRMSSANRMMICEAGRSLTDFGGSSLVVYKNSGIGVISTLTTGPMCWFDKTDLTIKNNLVIDSYNESLAVDSDKPKSITISERYYGPIKKIMNNPTVEGMFHLPVSVFNGFDFGLVYLKTKDLTGYFFVQKIENYKDALTPVKVDLLYID